MPRDPYPADVLKAPRRKAAPAPELEAARGLVVEERASGFTGEVVAVEKGFVTLRDRHDRDREFPLTPRAFTIDGKPVTLVRPRVAAATGPWITASGSRAAAPAPARVAQPSRIFVEGVHDAALVEKVWGDDLRELGIPVEFLEGIDDLPAIVRDFAPRPGRRLGVLVDHLVPGSKESRIVAELDRRGGRAAAHVLVTGHPYVDIWQGVRPRALGISSWPVIPKGQPWKEGICAALGVSDPPTMWRRVLSSVSTYADLEPPLVGAVEQLIDFLTEEVPA
jgi:hypothetical protein